MVNRKRIFIVMLISIILFIFTILSQGLIQNSEGVYPNIIFILIDTLRPDHLGCYGYLRNTSSQIDSLANHGIVFKNTISQSPWTKPSIASLFTSTLPSTHGVTWRGRNKTLPKSMLTLAEVLKQNGYKTVAFSDNPHITKCNGFDQGFDTFIENYDWLKGNAEPLTNKVLNWFRENYQKKYFIYIHYLDPHDPYNAPGIYHDIFLNKKVIDVSNTVKRGNTYVLNGEYHLDRRMKEKLKSISNPDYPLPTPLHISKKELNYLIDLYDGEIRYVDYQVGRIISVLKELKIYDKTTIIISSDHGEEFLEHGMFRHGYHLYDEIIKVPLIIISPHFNKTPLKIETPVNLIDLMPTVLDLLGIPSTSGMKGKSLIPLINQDERVESLSISETSWKGSSAQTLRLANWKYINDIRNERTELFNLGEDSGERNNLHLKESKRAKKLSCLLSDIISKAYHVTEKSKGKDTQLENKQLEKLKSLGYIQ
ncbi:MAG: hypothetical protein AMJ42_02670 [Deltaproteobacteria bacterium DG_8]|nr:MAG: hypothetical protein AMJ42_02670 [Deltaproteobacteria bacterium DG_8]